MRTLKLFALSLPGVLLACSATSRPVDDGGSDARQLLQRQVAASVVTLEQAIDIAVAAHPDSQALEADLEGDEDEVRFEVELLLDGEVLEVEIDAVTGEIIADEDEEDEDAEEEEEEEEELDDEVAEVAGATDVAEAAAADPEL